MLRMRLPENTCQLTTLSLFSSPAPRSFQAYPSPPQARLTGLSMPPIRSAFELDTRASRQEKLLGRSIKSTLVPFAHRGQTCGTITCELLLLLVCLVLVRSQPHSNSWRRAAWRKFFPADRAATQSSCVPTCTASSRSCQLRFRAGRRTTGQISPLLPTTSMLPPLRGRMRCLFLSKPWGTSQSEEEEEGAQVQVQEGRSGEVSLVRTWKTRGRKKITWIDGSTSCPTRTRRKATCRERDRRPRSSGWTRCPKSRTRSPIGSGEGEQEGRKRKSDGDPRRIVCSQEMNF